MIGLNLLFRLGRKFLAAPLEDSGLMPASYYRSQALSALESDDFAESLRYLKLADGDDPRQLCLVIQLLVLRLRLLQEQHQYQCRAIQELLQKETQPDRTSRYQEVLSQEEVAVRLLSRHEQEALRLSVSSKQ
jgi:hypothetical protein